MKKIIDVLLSFVLMFALCTCLVSCSDREESTEEIWENAMYTEDTVIGEGEKTITVKVTAKEKNVTFTVNTDSDTLGGALVENKLVSGEEGPFGLYIKYVNGIYADYEVNHFYWSISKDGQALMTGADGEKISGGEKYEFSFTE